MVSPFLTRLESCRDPQVLWPVAAGLSVLAHGLLLGLQPWVKSPSPSVPPEAETIPIQLVGPPPVVVNADPPSAPVAMPPSPPTLSPLPLPAEPAPAQTPPVVADPTPRPTLRPSVIPQPTPTPDSPPPVPPPNQPPTPAGPAVTPPSVTPPPPVTPPPTVMPPSVTPPPAGTPPPVTPPPNAGLTNGQLQPLGLSATPYGSDWPDTPPQLLSYAAIAVEPWLTTCGVGDLGDTVGPGTTLQIPLRVRVETDGRISATYVDVSSGNPALDNLVSCIGQRQLRLAPATIAGQPQATDAYQVDIQVQF